MNTAKERIEIFAEQQKDGFFPCPRCGRMVMGEKPVRNALSRRVDVYICNDCGMIEALEDMADSIIPLEEWAIITFPEFFR